jgi:hypothetical protein
MLFGPKTEIAEHLHGFGILYGDMLFFNHGFHEILMHGFAHCSPERAVLHCEEVRAAGYPVGEERVRTVTVFRALAVDQFLDQFSGGQDDGGACAEFERVNAAVGGGPFGESEEGSAYIFCFVFLSFGCVPRKSRRSNIRT